MNRQERRAARARNKRRRVCSIDDPRLDESARKVLRATLALFAKECCKHPAISEEEAIAGVIKLWEHGYVQILERGDHFEIDLCFPEEASQLQGGLAMIEQ